MNNSHDLHIPFTRFCGWLKCHRPNGLSALENAALQFAFPKFLDRTDLSASEQETMKRMLDRYDYVVARSRAPRRFAGDGILDFTLPRGSYYTVCHENSADDQTLACEMSAYADTSKTGLLFTCDLANNQFAERFRQDTQNATGLFFLPLPGRPSPFLPIAAQHLGCSVKDLECKDFLTVPIPYELSEKTIERVIDLRLPTTREWFWEKFRNGDGEVLRVIDDNGVPDFPRMLATLMWPTLGGHPVCQAIGRWMRINNVNALIFPSARSNTRCKITNGKLERATGWNLVDYRGAPPINYCESLVQIGWETGTPGGLTVSAWPIGDINEGSFVVDGPVENQIELHKRGFDRFIARETS